LDLGPTMTTSLRAVGAILTVFDHRPNGWDERGPSGLTVNVAVIGDWSTDAIEASPDRGRK